MYHKKTETHLNSLKDEPHSKLPQKIYSKRIEK